MYSWLPPLLDEIAEMAGLEAALSLAEAAGGEKRYIPERPAPDHWLTQACGPEAAGKIGHRFGGTLLEIPRGPAGNAAKTAKRIRDMLAQGASSNEIARVTGVVFRTVTRHRAKARKGGKIPRDSRQQTLL